MYLTFKYLISVVKYTQSDLACNVSEYNAQKRGVGRGIERNVQLHLSFFFLLSLIWKSPRDIFLESIFVLKTISKHRVSEEVANKSCLDIAKHWFSFRTQCFLESKIHCLWIFFIILPIYWCNFVLVLLLQVQLKVGFIVNLFYIFTSHFTF